MINNNFDNGCYVGYAKNISKRWGKHRSPSKKEQHKHLYRSMAKHGRDNFFITELECHETLESVKRAEIEVIRMFKDTGVKLYNHSDGGEGNHGYKWTDEQKTKRKGNKYKVGYKLTEEQIENCRQAKSTNNKAVICLNNNYEYKSITQAARELGLQRTLISKVLRGDRSHTCGYKFRYKESN